MKPLLEYLVNNHLNNMYCSSMPKTVVDKEETLKLMHEIQHTLLGKDSKFKSIYDIDKGFLCKFKGVDSFDSIYNSTTNKINVYGIYKEPFRYTNEMLKNIGKIPLVFGIAEYIYSCDLTTSDIDDNALCNELKLAGLIYFKMGWGEYTNVLIRNIWDLDITTQVIYQKKWLKK